jgi:tetratricopeptide (TPR) repeat protein
MVMTPQVATPPPVPAPAPLPKADVEPGAYYHFIRGHQLELSRNYDLALSEYLAALTYAPMDKELLSRAATLYLANGDLRGAVETAESALVLYPDDTGLLLFLSKLYQREGDDALSDKTFLRLIALDPDNAKSYYLLVLSYIRQERFADAEALIATVSKKDPESALPDYYQGRIDRAKGNFRRAESHYKRSIRQDPRFEAGYLDLAALYEDLGKRSKARDVYETVVADVNPLSPLARDRLIQMYLQDRDLERVLVHYNALLEFNPRNPTLLARKAMILSEQGHQDEAIEAISRVLVLMPSDVRTLEMLGSLYESVTRLDDARATYRRIIELDPTHVNAHVRLGYIANNQKNTAEREEILSAAELLLEADPNNTTLHLFISWGHLRASRYEEAVDVLQQAVVVEPDNMAVHFSLGATYYELKRYEDMTREMRWVVDKDPQHAYALNFLSYSFAERGVNLDEAVTLVKRALKIVPNDGLFLDSLAWAYYKQGNYKQALKVQRKAIKHTDEADAVLYDHLGSIYLAMGRDADAKESWILALEQDPSDADMADRFRDAGFGDPDQMERVLQARERAAADADVLDGTSPATDLP